MSPLFNWRAYACQTHHICSLLAAWVCLALGLLLEETRLQRPGFAVLACLSGQVMMAGQESIAMSSTVAANAAEEHLQFVARRLRVACFYHVRFHLQFRPSTFTSCDLWAEKRESSVDNVSKTLQLTQNLHKVGNHCGSMI